MTHQDMTETTVDRDVSARRERRYIYGGDTHAAARPVEGRSNRRAIRRKVSTFNVIVGIFTTGIAIVLYVGNILAVNALAREIGSLQAAYDRVVSTNATLRAEVTRKAAMERIGTIAAEELKLRYPAAQAEVFGIDEELEGELTAGEEHR